MRGHEEVWNAGDGAGPGVAVLHGSGMWAQLPRIVPRCVVQEAAEGSAAFAVILGRVGLSRHTLHPRTTTVTDGWCLSLKGQGSALDPPGGLPLDRLDLNVSFQRPAFGGVQGQSPWPSWISD